MAQAGSCCAGVQALQVCSCIQLHIWPSRGSSGEHRMLITGVQQATASLTHSLTHSRAQLLGRPAHVQGYIIQSFTCWGGRLQGWCQCYAKLQVAATPSPYDTDMHVQSVYMLGIHCNATDLTLC